jgi:hypothetical protein
MAPIILPDHCFRLPAPLGKGGQQEAR